jgi:hypothetical protein
VAVAGTETHAVFVAASVTVTPDAGAATGEPPLSSRMVIVAGNAGLSVAEACVMFSAPVLDT